MNNSNNFDASLSDDGRYRLLVEAISDYAIYMLDPSGVVSNWNSGAQRFKGYRPSEIIGKNFEVFYTDEDRAEGRPTTNLRRAAEEGRFEDEGWRIRKDGSRFWAHVVIDRILDTTGNLVGFAKITRDLTERHQAQQELERAREALFQSQKMEAIGQLTGGVAHDFNNLLMAVIGSLELVQRRMTADPAISPFIDNALKGARRGAVLTQRMLAFARRQELKMGAVDLKATVDGMTDLLERSLGPSIFIRKEFAEGLPLARTDTAQLETAILNLVVNARDAMPDGGTVRVRARHKSGGRDRPGTYVVLSVIDEGEGMDEDTLARATEPFFTTKGVGKGTGLGLSMVHGLAQQSGGFLELKSVPKVGTTAEIWLPVADADAAEAGVAASPLPESRKGLRVLAVDDDSLVLLNTVAMLEELGHVVAEARSGHEALEVLERQPIDLLITDQGMPRMTGAELAAKVQSSWPDIRIIIATGYAELTDSKARSLPRLGKPFSDGDLASLIASTVAGMDKVAAAETAASGRHILEPLGRSGVAWADPPPADR